MSNPKLNQNKAVVESCGGVVAFADICWRVRNEFNLITAKSVRRGELAFVAVQHRRPRASSRASGGFVYVGHVTAAANCAAAFARHVRRLNLVTAAAGAALCRSQGADERAPP